MIIAKKICNPSATASVLPTPVTTNVKVAAPQASSFTRIDVNFCAYPSTSRLNTTARVLLRAHQLPRHRLSGPHSGLTSPLTAASPALGHQPPPHDFRIPHPDPNKATYLNADAINATTIELSPE
eukprot:g39636.t1